MLICVSNGRVVVGADSVCASGQLSSIIFFIAFVQMMYYLGVMQWLIKNLCVHIVDNRDTA